MKTACFTYYSPHCTPAWLAIHRETAINFLSEYDLTEAQKTNVGDLMAGYCRSLDDAGLIHYGDTESEAVSKACGLTHPQREREVDRIEVEGL